jgi:hypothetical protein
MAQTRANTPASNSANRSDKPIEVQQLRESAFCILLERFKPFLDTIGNSELADIPRAADAMRRRPGGTRSLFHPLSPQPIEVIPVRVEQQIIGALLLRRQWMEDAFQRGRGSMALPPHTPSKDAAMSD